MGALVFPTNLPKSILGDLVYWFQYEPCDDRTVLAICNYLSSRYPGPDWDACVNARDEIEISATFDDPKQLTFWLLQCK